MLRIITLSILSLFFLASNVNAAEVSQFVSSLIAPVPISEELLNGDVELVVFSVEYAESSPAEYTERITGTQNISVWEKVCLDNTVTPPPPNMAFLMPQSLLQQNPKPFYCVTSSTGEKYACFLAPPINTGRGIVGLGDFFVSKYDTRGRIRDMNYLSLRWNSTGTGFRYTFEYGDEDDCQEARIFFRKDEGYVHGDKEIAPGEDVQICLITLQYENGRLKKFSSNDSNYFMSPEKTELTYDERGFLTSKAQFNGPDENEPRYTWYYRNHEQDHFGNWIRRDVYYNEQQIGTYKREIYYAGDTLPDFPKDLAVAENTELDSETKWSRDFIGSIYYLLSCASTFCKYEFLRDGQ